jgi:hypothetical protein
VFEKKKRIALPTYCVGGTSFSRGDRPSGRACRDGQPEPFELIDGARFPFGREEINEAPAYVVPFFLFCLLSFFSKDFLKYALTERF